MKNDKPQLDESIIYSHNLKKSYLKILEEKEKNENFNSKVIFFIEMENVFQNIDIYPIIKKLELNGITLFATQSKDFEINLNKEFCILKYRKQQIYTISEFTELFIIFISSQSMSNLITLSQKNNKEINSANIPQFSNFDNGSRHIAKTLIDCGNFGPNFVMLGRYLTDKGKNEVAYRKYGENHSKLANLLGLSLIESSERPNKIYLTHLGLEYSKINFEEQNELITKLCLQIPIVSESLEEAQNNKINIREKLLHFLSKSTVDRRIPNVMHIFMKIKKSCSEKTVSDIFNNIER